MFDEGETMNNQNQVNQDKLIEKYKKFNYNFFWLKSIVLEGVLYFLSGAPFYILVEEMFGTNRLRFCIFIFFIVVLTIICCIYRNKNKKRKIKPFKKSKNFVGIYNIDDLNRRKKYYDDKLISREKEVKYIKKILKKKIFKQSSKKQSICIIGESGSGKSTIINRLLNELNNVDVINCTNQYRDLDIYIIKRFKKDTLEEVYADLRKGSRKRLFIFDQFERFFYLDYKEQEKLRDILLNKLAIKNVASIFILRSDYLSNFVYNININDISENINYPNGTLVNSFGKDWYSNNYLLYCKNTIDKDFPLNYDDYQEKLTSNRNKNIQSLCNNAFGEKEELVYNRFRNKRLIEQQIYLNLLENKRGTTNFSDFLKNSTERDLMVQYYDRQLCSTGNYYISAKIMYLLSMGRIYNILYSVTQIYEALLASLDVEIQNIEYILSKLLKLQLIKLVQQDNKHYYEVVHDYIAESFIEYAGVNLHEYAKNTLDDYRINLKNEDYKKTIKKCLKAKKSKKIFERSILFLVIIVITLNSIYQFFFFNNKYPIIVSLPLYLASYYGYCLYTNIFKLYVGKNKWIISFLYIMMAFFVIAGSMIYQFWLFFAGIATFLIGMSFLVIRNSNKISRVSKKFYTDFSAKVSATGLVIFIAAWVFYFTHVNFYIGIFLIIAELVYAYGAQLSEEYYYYCVGLMNSK